MLLEANFSLNSKIMREVINIICLMCERDCMTTNYCPADVAFKQGRDIERIELIGVPNERKQI